MGSASADGTDGAEDVEGGVRTGVEVCGSESETSPSACERPHCTMLEKNSAMRCRRSIMVVWSSKGAWLRSG